jgi:hypothetical protein
MKDLEQKLAWTPPQMWLRRSHVYAVIAVLTAIGVLIALTGEMYFGSLRDESYEGGSFSDQALYPSAPVPEPDVESIDAVEAQVLSEGYQAANPWAQIQVPAGEQGQVSVTVEANSSYVMLATSASGCETDLVLSDSVQDTSAGPIARVDFDTSSPGEVAVVMPASSSDGSACDVSYVLYKR